MLGSEMRSSPLLQKQHLIEFKQHTTAYTTGLYIVSSINEALYSFMRGFLSYETLYLHQLTQLVASDMA